MIPRLSHRPLCCIASCHRKVSVENLSPFMVALLVKPAKSLSFQPWTYQTFDEASANFLNCQLGPPM